MPIDENLLWSRTLDPISGKIVKEDTFLGALLKFSAIIAIGIIYIYFLAPIIQAAFGS